jgi:hypothetical protein
VFWCVLGSTADELVTNVPTKRSIAVLVLPAHDGRTRRDCVDLDQFENDCRWPLAPCYLHLRQG